MTSFLIAVAALSLALVAPIVHADTLLYADGFSVHDATGARIGASSPVSDAVWRGEWGGSLTVEFRYGAVPVIARWQPRGFVPTWLRFPYSNCKGQVYLDAAYTTLVSNGYSNVAGPRSTVYLETGPAAFRTMRSSLPPSGVCENHEDRHFVAPARATNIHLDDLFVPPFTIQATGQTPVSRVP